jgi:uncharacterized membrane protein YfcA
MNAALVAAAFVISFAAEFAYGLTSFGPGIIFEVAWEICSLWGLGSGTITGSIMMLVIMEVAMGLVQSYHLFKTVNWSMVAYISIPMAPAIVAGSELLARFDNDWLKRSIGCVLLLMAIHQVVGDCFSKRKAETEAVEFKGWRVKAALVVTGACAGFMRGLFGIAGPPMMVFVTSFPVNQLEWRSSNAVMRVILNLVQGVYVGVVQRNLSLRKQWPVYVALLLGGLCGLITGNTHAHRIDRSTFRCCLLVFLFYGSCLMCVAGFETVEKYVVYGIVAISMLAAIFLVTFAEVCRLRSNHVGGSAGAVGAVGATCAGGPTEQSENTGTKKGANIQDEDVKPLAAPLLQGGSPCGGGSAEGLRLDGA